MQTIFTIFTLIALLMIQFSPMILPFAFTARSKVGMQLVYEIEGFKQYLRTSEKDRFKKSTLKDRYQYAGYGIVLGISSPSLKPLYDIVDKVDDTGFVIKKIFTWKFVRGILAVIAILFIFGRLMDFGKSLF